MPTRPANKITGRKAAKKPRKTLPYDRLLKLVPKMKPPQTWYEEGANPFAPRRARQDDR